MTTTVTTTQSTVSGQVEKVETDVSITLENGAGWQGAADAVESALEKSQTNIGADVEKGPMSITIYLADGEDVDKAFFDSLAGKDVTITVVSRSGVIWRVNGKDIDPESKERYELDCELTVGSAKLREKLGVSTCYVLRFPASARVNIELMVPLGGQLALQNATLLKGKDLAVIQSAVVDQDGYAHFYLASVDKRGEYYIAVNLPGTQSSAIIPDKLADAYGSAVSYEPIQYEITGRTSSWGMTFGQVTWIMVALLVGCVVVVGAVMFTLNKRKLKLGYVPNLDDEDE